MTPTSFADVDERVRLTTTLTPDDSSERLIRVAAQTAYRHWRVRAERGNTPWVIVKLAFTTIDSVRGCGSIFDFWFPIHGHLSLLASDRGCMSLLFNLIQFVEDHEGREFFQVGRDAPF